MSENDIKPVLWELSCEVSFDGTDVLESLEVRPCHDGRFVHIDDYTSAIDRLTAERDAAVADVERLNWLEQFVRKTWMYGASFDFVKAFDGEGGGYRFMTRHRLDDRQPTLRKSIDAARAEIK